MIATNKGVVQGLYESFGNGDVPAVGSISGRALCAVSCLILASGLVDRAAAASGAAQAETRAVSFFDLETRVPSTWTEVEPSSSMRLLQLAVPGEGADAAADSAAEVVVFFFGRGQGGDVESNIGRWRGQFSSAEGGAVEPKVETFEVAGMPVTVAELSGTYSRGVGGAPAVPAPDQTLVAAIIETERGSLFVQIHGAMSTVAANRAAFDSMLRELGPTRF